MRQPLSGLPIGLAKQPHLAARCLDVVMCATLGAAIGLVANLAYLGVSPAYFTFTMNLWWDPAPTTTVLVYGAGEGVIVGSVIGMANGVLHGPLLVQPVQRAVVALGYLLSASLVCAGIGWVVGIGKLRTEANRGVIPGDLYRAVVAMSVVGVSMWGLLIAAFLWPAVLRWWLLKAARRISE